MVDGSRSFSLGRSSQLIYTFLFLKIPLQLPGIPAYQMNTHAAMWILPLSGNEKCVQTVNMSGTKEKNRDGKRQTTWYKELYKSIHCKTHGACQAALQSETGDIIKNERARGGRDDGICLFETLDLI